MTRVEHRSVKTGGKDDWQTPSSVLNRVRLIDDIGLDPMTNDDNPVGARVYYTAHDDGLVRSWCGEGLVFVNPPYSRTKEVISHAMVQHHAGAEIVALVASRTDTLWFQCALDWATGVCFWRGRLRFVGAEHSAPFPSAVLYFGPRVGAFISAFGPVGVSLRLNP